MVRGSSFLAFLGDWGAEKMMGMLVQSSFFECEKVPVWVWNKCLCRREELGGFLVGGVCRGCEKGGVRYWFSRRREGNEMKCQLGGMRKRKIWGDREWGFQIREV